MNGIEKLRNVPEQWRTGSLVDWCRGVAYQIEREHQDELNERIEAICELDREIAQLRAELAAAKRDMTEAAERADMAAATLNDVSEMVFGEVRGPEHAGELLVELGKRLMPLGMEWLRYDDGEKVLPSDEGIIGIEYSQTGNTVLVTTSDDEPRVVFVPSERVKRPEPEVLGADGLPIKVGETVYLDAEHADMAGKDLLDSYFSCGLHGVDAGAMLTVSEVKGAGKVSLESDNDAWCPASWLTHTPPDTQKRIDEDARKSACDYFGRAGKWCNGEGGCPAYSLNEHEFEGCRHFATADLLRRQRELDAKTMGGDAS